MRSAPALLTAALLALATLLATACDDTTLVGAGGDGDGPSPFAPADGAPWAPDGGAWGPDGTTPTDVALADGGADACPGCGAIPSGFCGAREDGDWCSGAKLITCAGGKTAATTPCPAGCLAPPGGLAHTCAPAGDDSPCAGRPDGALCDGSALVGCAGGEVTADFPCPLGCLDAPEPHCASDAGEQLCGTKPDGTWCSASVLVTCAGGLSTGQVPCSLGCVDGPPAACEETVDDLFCTGKDDGPHCSGSVLVTCHGGQASSQSQCLNGCVAGAGADFCSGGAGADFCTGKADGPVCKGQTLVTCAADHIASTSPCPFGCVVTAGADACGAATNPGFCAGMANGPHCNGPTLATCQGGQVTAELGCPFGCLSGAVDTCAGDTFCAPVPAKESESPPAEACSAMDWSLEPDGFYLISKFGTTSDPTTTGNATSCGYLQSLYNQHGCVWDQGAGACVGGDPEIPWIHGHVDWDYAKAVAAGAAPGDSPSPEYFYVADAQRFGCGATLRVSNPATGACVVVYVEDGGPGAKYEGATYGNRRILDASPAVVQRLGVQHIGWKNSDLVRVEWGQPGDVPGHVCEPCASTPAKVGTEASAAPWNLLHLVPSCGAAGDGCPSGPGLYCGTGELDPSGLYYCANGAYSLTKTCAGGCQSNPPGTPDGCAGETPSTCPDGDGFYCGEGVGLVPGTLYACKGGTFAVTEACPGGCQTMPSGTNDQCAGGAGACPSGDGAYCGAAAGKDPGTLYSCAGGTWTVKEVCAGGCQVMPPGSSDQCYGGPAACPSGNGAYCGAAAGKDPGTLYGCANGAWTVLQACPNGCEQMPAGQSDQCKGAACPGGDGAYCGEAVGATAGTLYQCKSGALTPLQTCPSGCEQMPAGTNDQCKSGGGGGACPGANGLYCGSALGKDAGTLYQCTNGTSTAVQTCANGCQSNPPGTPDACAGSVSGKLELCNPFKPPLAVTCGFGCYGGHKGSDYATANGTPVFSPVAGTVVGLVNTVPGQTCTPDFGNYVKINTGVYDVILGHMSSNILVAKNGPVSIGQPVGYVSNTGYTLSLSGGEWKCQAGGGYHLHLETRKNGAAFDPYASGDVVWGEGCGGGGGGGSCPNGNGLYCGGSVGKDAATLYNCAGGAYTVVQVCPNGCQTMPAGQSDQCAGGGGGTCPSGDGLYCGGALGKDPGTLYNCAGGNASVAQVCPNGCQTMPAGQSDQCAAGGGSCPSGDGLYCGGALGKDPGTLYTCAGGATSVAQVCPNGCQSMPAGQSDQCAATTPKCPDGNGLYCGGALGKDGNTLYKCTDGSISEVQKCSDGCQSNPPGSDDACKAATPKCPDGNGLYCGGALGKDGNTLYKCTDGSISEVQKCSDGCQSNPPGSDDACKAASGGCPSGNGLYCGSSLGKDSKTLYNCSNGSTSVAAYCTSGCTVAPPGQSDSCAGGSCPSGNGAYCGQTGGLSSSALYNCSNGKWTVIQQCSGTCQVAPPGQPDKCP